MSLNFRLHRLISILALVGILLSALAGCQQLLPMNEPVTITFMYPDIDKGYYEGLLPKFKELYPYITVQLKTYQWFRNRPDLDNVDVYVASSWNNFGEGNLDFNQMLNLDSYISQESSFNPEEFYAGALDAFRKDGQLMAVPYGLDPYVMYYNRQVFKSYNIAAPQPDWTWNEFLQIAQKLTDPAVGTYGYVASEGYPDAFFFLFQHGGRLVDATGSPTLNDPANIAAMEWYSDLYHKYQVAPTHEEAQKAFGYGRDPAVVGIVSGKAGMWAGSLTYRWALQQYVQGAKFDWGMVPLPRDVVAFTGAFFEGYAINKESLYADASWKWIFYLSQQIPERLMPARRPLAESVAYEQRVGREIANATRASMENAILASPDMVDQLGNSFTQFMEAVQNMVDNGVPAREALETAQQKALQP